MINTSFDCVCVCGSILVAPHSIAQQVYGTCMLCMWCMGRHRIIYRQPPERKKEKMGRKRASVGTLAMAAICTNTCILYQTAYLITPHNIYEYLLSGISGSRIE
ncbi:hypothetical protein CHUAL_012873 [Chamberlinius hualienensis]